MLKLSIKLSFAIGLIAIVLSSCTPSKEYLRKQGSDIAGDSSFIKVLVFKTDEIVKISSDSQMKISYLKSGDTIYKGDGKEFTYFADKLPDSILIESWTSPLKVNGIPYRGSIELHSIVGTGKIFVVNIVTMQDYLCGVVPSEMSGSWPLEAVKAQAVAARTYAYYHMKESDNKIYDLDATTNFQVYKGKSAETENTNKAVMETAGTIMVYNNQPILALFHSTSGGSIISNKYVWDGEEMPYLQDKVVPFGKNSPYYNWETDISLFEMRKLLNLKYSNVGPIKGLSFKKHNGRIIQVTITHANGIVKLSGNDFRLLFPNNKIKSQLFEVKRTNYGLHVTGHGWGHGVGMCQYSAKEMAEKGDSYDQILKYFYQGIEITKFKRI